MAQVNASELQPHDKSSSAINLQYEQSQSNINNKDNSMMFKNEQVLIYENKKLIPFYLGGFWGYYVQLSQQPFYDVFETLLEGLSLGILVGVWVFFQIQYNEFQDYIPLIINSFGDVTKMGQKEILYIFPGVDTFVFIILTIMQLITNRFQYSIQVTPDNAKQIFKLTRTLILLIKLWTMIMFIFLTFGTMSMIRHTIDGYIMAYIVFVFLFYGGSYYWYVIQLQKIANKYENN